MYRNLILPLSGAAVLGAGLLGACTTDSDSTTRASKVVQALCTIDGIVQPVAVDLGEVIASANGYGSEAQLAATIDGKLHADIVAACAAKGGVVATTTTTSAAE